MAEMKPIPWLALLLLSFLPYALSAQNPDTEITAALNTQVEAWNKADLPAFVQTYAPNCLFVGKNVTEGNSQVLARYRKAYPTPAAMGHLTFSELAVHPLTTDVAIVTGRFHLDRTAAAGGPANGIFSLVFQQLKGQWKIALDHTS